MARRIMWALAALSTAITFVVFIDVPATVGSADGGCCNDAPTTRSAGNYVAGERIDGEFTGAFVDGVPVYRLPPMTVARSRQVELARIDEEERRAAAIRVAVDGAR